MIVCQETERLTTRLSMVRHQIYELKKGVRNVSLSTFRKEEQAEIEHLLLKNGIDYFVQPVNDCKVNIFFGKKICMDALKRFVNKPLNQLSPEEDFIIGALLGYDICQQCERYCFRKVSS